MNSALHENEAELGVLVLTIALEVLSDGDSLLDQVVEVLGEGRCETALLQDSEDLVTGDPSDLGNAVPISEHDTDLRGSHALLCQLANVIDHIISGQLQPLFNKRMKLELLVSTVNTRLNLQLGLIGGTEEHSWRCLCCCDDCRGGSDVMMMGEEK